MASPLVLRRTGLAADWRPSSCSAIGRAPALATPARLWAVGLLPASCCPWHASQCFHRCAAMRRGTGFTRPYRLTAVAGLEPAPSFTALLSPYRILLFGIVGLHARPRLAPQPGASGILASLAWLGQAGSQPDFWGAKRSARFIPRTPISAGQDRGGRNKDRRSTDLTLVVRTAHQFAG